MEESIPSQNSGKNRFPWGLLVLAIVASASAVVLFENGDTGGWDCEPMTPGAANPSTQPCFDASLTHQNVVTLRWLVNGATDQVYIYSDKPPGHSDPGIQPAHCPEQNGICSLQIPLEQGGHYRWTIAAGSGDETVHATTGIDLPTPPPPTLSLSDSFVDLLTPGSRAFSWSLPADAGQLPAADGPVWIEIRKPGARSWEKDKLPEAGQGAAIEVPASLFIARGEYIYSVRRCHYPPGSGHKFCSQAAQAGFRAGYDQFKGLRNRHVVAGEPLEIEFTTRSGNTRFIRSATLIGQDTAGMVVTTGGSISIPGEAVTAGTHELELDSCLFPEQKCSNRREAARAPDDGVFWQRNPGEYAAGEIIGTLFPDNESDPVLVHTAASGNIVYTRSGPIYRVRSDEILAHSFTAPADMLTLVASSPTHWSVNRPYTMDFHPGTGISVKGFGQALDIAFDVHGGIWMSNEFSNGAEYITPSGEAIFMPFPMARERQRELNLPSTTRQVGTAHPISKPYSYPTKAEGSGSTSISSLAEKVAVHDGTVWFTQGGGLLTGQQVSGLNRSRVISFDNRREDSHTTPYDDRFCVYDIPSDPSHILGNSQIVGLAVARGRVWIAESRGMVDEETSYLSSFVPNPEACTNHLDFSDPEAVATMALKYCEDGRSPEQDGCVDRVPMLDTERAIKIVHLEADPAGGLLWFTDASGQFVGSFDMDGERGFTLYSIPDNHYRQYDTIANLGGFPWDLQVTADAVYIGEHATRHILRLDKENGSFDEILIPHSGPSIRLHSLALDALRRRLWFTLANVCAAPGEHAKSTLGYIDLDSWDEYLAKMKQAENQPAPVIEITGVIYSDLDTIPACTLHPGQHQSFRGIAIDSATGRIALATMFREQITLLEPLPGFWP